MPLPPPVGGAPTTCRLGAKLESAACADAAAGAATAVDLEAGAGASASAGAGAGAGAVGGTPSDIPLAAAAAAAAAADDDEDEDEDVEDFGLPRSPISVRHAQYRDETLLKHPCCSGAWQCCIAHG